MKAYFLNAKQIQCLIEMGQNHPERNRFIGDVGYMRPEDMAEKVVKELGAEPIELTEASLGELNAPCKFFPMQNIAGFVTKDGALRGVFVKEIPSHD